MKKNAQTSKVWNFFDKEERGARCKLCKKRIACFGNTSNIMKHLRRLHKAQYSLVVGSLQKKSQDSSDFEDYPILKENLENQSSLNINGPPQQPDKDNKVDFGFYNNVAGGVAADEDAGDTAAEANSAVHTIQAYRDVNGTTFLYLQPAAEGETAVQVQGAHFQPVVASSESITANGEIVSVAVQKDGSVLEGQVVDGEAKTPEEAGTRRLVHVPVKNHQGSALSSRAVVRQVNRPNPIKTTPSASSNNSDSNSHKEDCFDAFGKYIASMLRNLSSKTACKLQGEIVNWILKEQMKSNDS